MKSSIDKISNLENNHKKTIAYARVSTHKQKNDLENQKSFLKNYCIEKKINNFEVISDLGSGLNFKKNGLNNYQRILSVKFKNKHFKVKKLK